MQVLIISHNAFSETNNLGKTLLYYFSGFSTDEIAQFYIQDKYPETIKKCNIYYRFTDRDALKSLFGIKTRHIFQTPDLTPTQLEKLDHTIESIRQYGRRRNVFVYFMRNIVWRFAQWRTKELADWLRDFDPDVILFMSGDYKFMYDITFQIQALLNKPLVVWCGDDYYLYNRNESSFLGRLQHKQFMKTVFKVINTASCIFTVSDMMNSAYHNLFNKPCFTLHTGAKKRNEINEKSNGMIAYFGNLGYKRADSLVEIGKAVMGLGISGPKRITVYSAEKNPNIIKKLSPENGIDFRGEISSSEVSEKMSECKIIIHTESFDARIQQMIKYSVSTKIADSLLNGPCMLVYGPAGIASIDYLKSNNAAYVITKPEDLKNGLQEILTNDALRAQIVTNARHLANKNHNEADTSKKVRAWLQMAIDGII